jgi:hypothetical protein
MKTILFMILLIVPFVMEAQRSREPSEGTNTILIETGISASDAFLKWGRHLAQNGYSIDKSNNYFYTFTTGPKDTSKFNCDFIVNSTVTDSGTIIVTVKRRTKSDLLAGKLETQFYDWRYDTSKGDVRYVIYQDLRPVIDSFGDYETYYEKR